MYSLIHLSLSRVHVLTPLGRILLWRLELPTRQVHVGVMRRKRKQAHEGQDHPLLQAYANIPALQRRHRCSQGQQVP
jgi:hypothetical protein